ncbi:hypothetical protein [Comamonas sp. JC664]|uniref:hypothetical protein n=1 Tax=Comamonas sp. JC664 TaxID=2801917 RepID=UPI00174CE973|nr:hypothetical protein [Comamonas sp. JC664]MBL0695805.1 hypothetical protein [Comamonas sp. JC664]GHG63595.1 hypothetical protein GCM10012319_03310 [Comamonas sp. KCTC 72670]
MKKLVAVAVVGLMGTLGLAARVDARPGVDGMEPTDAQVEAALDARQKLVLSKLLQIQQTDARTAAIHR